MYVVAHTRQPYAASVSFGAAVIRLKIRDMPLTGNYEPSTSASARKQAERYEATAGAEAADASLGGAPKHPVWYYNLKQHPDVELQDGPTKRDYIAREVTGDEKAAWWERAVDAWPDYAKYQAKTDRQIPVFVLERLES